jgi:hypothetical protein
MKAFFKGGEGWKYLTPEMLAAEKAGKISRTIILYQMQKQQQYLQSST